MPNRYLRPLTTSRAWNDCTPEGQSFFIRLINIVDDFGRHEADPVLLRALAYPLVENMTTKRVEDLCKNVVALVDFYEVGGKKFLQIKKWSERVRSKSRCPEPPPVGVTKPNEIAPSDSALGVLPVICPSIDSHMPVNCPPPTPCTLRLAPTPLDIEGGRVGDVVESSAEMVTVIRTRVPDALESAEFREIYLVWLNHLAAMGKPHSIQSMDIELATLAGWGAERAVNALKLSVRSRWKSVHEGRPQQAGGSNRGNIGQKFTPEPKNQSTEKARIL